MDANLLTGILFHPIPIWTVLLLVVVTYIFTLSLSSIRNGSKSEGNDGSASADTTVPAGKLKMILCVNMCLGMAKGKIAAQCGHATLGAYKKSMKQCPKNVFWWETIGQAKIAVKVDNDDALLDVANAAKSEGLVTYIVEDAGKTQIPAGSKTVLAIGPAPEAIINKVTGHLKLL